MALIRLAKEGKSLEKKVHDISKEQDQEIAALKLETLGIKIDKLTPEQEKYAKDYAAGT
jgi:adenosylhomocysteinase